MSDGNIQQLKDIMFNQDGAYTNVCGIAVARAIEATVGSALWNTSAATTTASLEA